MLARIRGVRSIEHGSGSLSGKVNSVSILQPVRLPTLPEEVKNAWVLPLNPGARKHQEFRSWRSALSKRCERLDLIYRNPSPVKSGSVSVSQASVAEDSSILSRNESE
jgi:hypothetical protein